MCQRTKLDVVFAYMHTYTLKSNRIDVEKKNRQHQIVSDLAEMTKKRTHLIENIERENREREEGGGGKNNE